MSQPSYSSANGYISEQFFTLVFDVALDSANPPPTSAFVVNINGTGVTVTGVTVDSAAHTVVVSYSGYSPLTPGDIIDYWYYDPTVGNDANAIQGLDGADSASFNSSLVVAITRPGPSAPAAPSLAGASDSGATGDGITNDATPTVSGTAAANATLKLYDTDGATVLGTTTADGAGNWSITSSTLSDGAHTLSVTQTDGNNATSPASTGLSLTIDTTAAAPTALAVAASSDSGTLGDGISNAGTPVIKGHAEANATVRLYDTDGTTMLGSANADGSGNWSITSSNLTEGVHTLTAKQTDVAGNVSAASAGFTYTHDTVGPINMALSTNNVQQSGATNGATIATLSSTDLTSVTYDFAVGNGVIDADNGKFTISGNALVAAQNLTAGTYHIYLSGTDAAGNAAYNIFSIAVTNGPSVSSIVRAAAAPSAAQSASTSLQYTVTFDQAVTGVDASDFALTASGTASGTVASVSGSGATYTVTVDNIAGDGTLRLDLNGSGTGMQNGSSTPISGGYVAGQTYTLDHTAPNAPTAPALTLASDSGVSNTDHITSVVTPIFTGTSEANASITLYDTDGATVLGTTTANGVGNWSITSSLLANGSHSVTAKASDAAGNVSSASAATNVVIATSAAAPTALAFASGSDSGVAGDGVTKIVTPTVTGHAAAGAAVTLYDTDGSTVLGATVADGSGNWSITSTTLANGSHTLTAKQTDLAGNVSSASSGFAVTIDAQAPGAPGAPSLSSLSDSGVQGDNITYVTTPVLQGTGEANATVTLYDANGATVLGTSTVDGSGHWSIASSALSIGNHMLTAKQTDLAGNVSAVSAALSLQIEATPAPPPPPTPLVDGVPVSSQVVVLPGGGTGMSVTVPTVTVGRVESTGNAGVADIPLATSNGSTLLLSQLPTGFGLTASGSSQNADASLQQLIQSIVSATPGHTIDDQRHLTGNGMNFLKQLSGATPLLVETVTPTSDLAGQSGALSLIGTSTATQRTSLVIDTTHMGANNKIQLSAVDFAAIIGAADVSANTGNQILTGDAAAQTFTVSASAGGAVFSGGGSDTLVFGAGTNTAIHTAAAASAPSAGTTTVLHGGQDSDTAVFGGNRADYTIESHQGYLVVTSTAQPTQHAVVINVESLQFADATVAVTNIETLSSIAGLYHNVLGRQADYQGIDYWGSAQQAGTSLGQVALDMIKSSEAQGRFGDTLNGNAAHDVELLYAEIFGRHSDADGLAYWTNAMSHGVTLEQVAQAFLTQAEGQGHMIDTLHWDFIV